MFWPEKDHFMEENVCGLKVKTQGKIPWTFISQGKYFVPTNHDSWYFFPAEIFLYTVAESISTCSWMT